MRGDEIEAEPDDTGQRFTPAQGEAKPDEDAEGRREFLIAESLLDQIEFEPTDDTNH